MSPTARARSTGSAARREQHLGWLLELTGLPTAAGREHAVIGWVERWVAARSNLRLTRDAAGNMIIRARGRGRAAGRPIFMTAHLDHPAFVVRRRIDDRTLELEFRGGVHDPYFEAAPIEIVTADDDDTPRPRATIATLDAGARPYKRVTARLHRAAPGIQGGDIGRWVFRTAEGRGNVPVVDEGLLYAQACDDLAGVAAALAALDVLRRRVAGARCGVLLTRAEEVGFIGAIASCRDQSVPKASRLICLENSRSFPESPIGAGPILRVGDRISVFSPSLTNRLGLLQMDYQKKHPNFAAQRRLMPGGACEASAFSAYGFESTCLCLPLGNYHNMQDIDGVLAGRRPARVGPEHISVEDYHGLIALLVHFVSSLDASGDADPKQRMEGLYRKHARVLGG